MNVTIPIYVEAFRRAGARATVYRCRPLFHLSPSSEDESLRRAMGRLARRLKAQLDLLGRRSRHDALADHHFHPELTTHLLKLTLDLRQRQLKCKLLFVQLESLGRRIAFTPSLPDLWFELSRGEDLQQRAVEVLTRHFRDLDKQDQPDDRSPESLSLDGDAWVESVELVVQTRQPSRQQLQQQLAALWDSTQMDGAVQLDRVGRCLDWLYPDDLDRAIGRPREVEELTRLLAAKDRRPVMLVGPRMAGKTTVLHEVVFRRVRRRRKPYATRRNVWLLSPQRLISGMSYVGQWQSRLLAILKEAERSDHVLYFDDILGLYYAGVSAGSNLCAADVLKTHVQNRDVRMLGEMTPEAFHAFAERDRGWADQFHVLPIPETGEEQTLRILLAVNRHLERKHRCRFDLDVLPAVMELHRQYQREAKFPGKAARFLRHLAVKKDGGRVTRETVLEEFRAQTGMSLSILDNRRRLERSEVLAALSRRMIGQPAALEAAADVISVAKARLNEPGRPLATLLFLGPTGVGKTQCAKTLAEYLFGHAEKVLRFDMNQYCSAEAAARLVGTMSEPEGLLTSAVRQRPFCVVLLDEIDKAHPDVFDLLLQVTGEGRLTDALGRTTDFGSAIVIMTANLGVREASRMIGFERDERPRAYVKAAEDFFRPEFLNRLDRIIPFRRLAPDDLRQIAALLIEEVFQREGLARRRSVLHVDARAMEKVTAEGYHPQLGARALRRAIQRQLVQPVAARLAAIKPEMPTVVSAYPKSAGITVHVQELRDAQRVPAAANRLPAEQLVRRSRQLAQSVQQQFEAYRPAGEISPGSITPEQFRYFAVEEQAGRVRRIADEIAEWIRRRREQIDSVAIPATARRHSMRRYAAPEWGTSRRILKEIVAAEDIHEYLREVLAEAEPFGDRSDRLQQEAALLKAMSQHDAGADDLLMFIRPLTKPAQEKAEWLARVWGRLFCDEFQLVCGGVPSGGAGGEGGERFLSASGPFASLLVEAEAGVHLFVDAQGSLHPVQVGVLTVETASRQARSGEPYFGAKRSWLGQLYRGEASADDDPFPLGPVIRVYPAGGPTLDLRSGLTSPRLPKPHELRTMLLASFPLPHELRQDIDGRA